MVWMRSRPVPVLSLLVATVALAACAGNRPGRGDPLVGWRPIEARAEDRTEYVRGSAIIHVLEPRETSVNVFAATFLDDGTTLQHIVAVSGSPNVTAVTRTPLRNHGGIHWIDLTFTIDGVARRARIAWFDSENELRVFRLITPLDDWNSTDISAFQNHVVHVFRETAPVEPSPPPEPED